jgi:tetratricopeptide (TPR) repeat protein/transcriptional regulator with XRE-family HTH domain
VHADAASSHTSEEVASQTFGVLLRRFRRAVGLTQEELAELSGLSARAVADIERGRTIRPYRSSVRALADALNLPDDERELLTRAGKPRGADPQPASGPGASATIRPNAAAAPCQLPGAVRCFSGREAELNALSGMLGEAGAGRTVVISAIGGTAGVGKTALAVRWAHLVAGQFADGQLYVNLRGYDADQPVSPAGALAGFLGALGVPGQEVPDDVEDRARLYRSRLAGRRVLVVLDNARNGEQVRPLLPGEPGCVAVVTSRDTLAGLVATDGAVRLDLDVLPLADAIGLLRSLIGQRTDEDPEATAVLAGLCARLPLALRIAAELAAARPQVPLADLAAELAASRLDLLDVGEDRADVRAVLSWSYRQLPDDVAAAFALLGLHPGEDLDVHAAAALTDTSAGQARRVLARLYRASLVQASGPGRYGMHDLLRAYAREQAAACDTDGWNQQSLTGLFDYYRSAAAAAMDVLSPAEAHQRPRVAAAAAALPAMPGEAEARAWLDGERPNLVAMAVHCASHGWPAHATGLAGILFRYLIDGCHLSEADAIYSSVLRAARRSGDLAAEAEALSGLGGMGIMKGQFGDAAGHYQVALERYRQCGDRAGQAKVLRNLGITELHLHKFKSAVSYLRLAVPAYEDAGDPLGVARTQVALAGAEIEMDSPDEAWQLLQRALPVFRAAKHQAGEAEALSRMGGLSVRQGQLTQAAAFHEQALAIFRHIDRPAAVATELCNLGDLRLRQGEHRQATSYLRQALALHRQTGGQHGEIMTLRSLAEALHGAGQLAAARAELAAALRLATETGHTYEQASAHADLAESHHSAGQDDQARQHWQQALTLYTQLGAPEADQVRVRLSIQEAQQAETPAGHAAS